MASQRRLLAVDHSARERQRTDARRRVAPHLPRFTVCSRIMKPVGVSVLPLARARDAVRLRRALWRLCARAGPRVLSVSLRPEDSAVALKGRPLVPYERIHRGHAPRRSRRACAPSGPRCSVEPAGARRTSSALVTGADCSQCVTDHGSALGCGCATDCGRPGSAVKAGFVAGRGGIRPRLGAGGAPPARLARCVGEVERERQGALEWVRPEIGACALQSAAAPAASGEPSSALENPGERALNLALGRTHIRSRSPRAGSVGLGREAGSGRALRLGEAPAVVSGGWGTSLDVCRALPAERLSCGGSLAAAVRPRCPSPGCQDPVRCRAGASPRPASSSRLRTGERQRTDARRRVAPHLPRFTVCSRIMKPVGVSVLPLARARDAVRLRRALWRLCARAGPRVLSVSLRPEDSAVALKGRPLVPYERIHRGHAPRRSRRACAPSGPRCSVEPAGARRTSSALVTGADCSQCVTDHGSALGCGCATDCGRPGSAVKAGFVAGRGGIRPRLGAGGAPPARLARCVGEVERERQGALEWVRPEIGACALQSAAAPAASGEPSSALENPGERALNLALGRTHIRSRSPRAGSVGLGREAGSGRALRLGEAPAVVSGGWGTSLDVCRALPAERLSCGGSLAAAVRPRCPSPGCQDPVRCRAGASPRPASSSRLRTGERQRTDARRRVAPHLPRFTVCSRIMKPVGVSVLPLARARDAVRLRRALWRLCARAGPRVLSVSLRPEDSAVALKGRPLVPYERIHRGHAPRRSRRACAPSGPRCSVEPAGARRTSSALVTGADCSQCVTDHGSALGCGCATDCGRPGSAVKAGFVAGRGGIRPRLGAGGAPPARLARCVGEVERERQGALEWVRPEIGACALQSAAAPAASGEPSSALENPGERALNLALGRTHIRSRSPRAGSVGLGREAGSGRALRLGEAPAVVSGGWGTSLDVCRALPAERLSCGGSLAAAVRPRCPSPGCQDPVRCRAGASPRPASSSRLRTGERQRTDARRRVAPHLPRFTVCSRIMKPVGVSVLPLARARDAVRLRRALWRLCARAGPRVLSVSLRPEDSAVALKGRPLVPYERIHRGHAPRRSRRACAPSGPRCSVEPAGARRTSSALVTGADCSQCVTDHGSALGCGCATDCGRPGSAVKAGFVAGRGGIRPRLGAGGAPPARLARCVGEVERERQGALEWVRPEIGACALQSAAAPAASGEPSSALENPGERALNLALGRTHIRSRSPRAGSVGLGREAGSGRALRLGEAPAVVSGGWGTSLDVCRALPAERLSCGGSLAAAVRPRCPSPGCQDPVRCRAGASPRPASSSRLRTGERQRTDARRRVAPHLPRFTVCSRIMKPVGVSVLPLARARDAVRLRRALWRLCARAGPRVLSVSLRPEDSAVALKGRPLVPYERIHRGHAPRRSRRACAPSGPRCSVEPAGARRTSSALVTGADCSQCVTDHGSALGCGCATDCGRPGSAVKAGFVAGRGGIRPRLGAGGAPPARLARCVGEVERERQGALEWVRPEIGACALQSAAAPAASGEPSSALENPGERALNLALGRTHIRSRSPRAGSVGLGREAGSGRALRLGEAPAVVSGGWGTSLDVCRALPAERLSCGGSLAAAVRPRCPSLGCQDPVRCRAGASPRPASSSRLRTGERQRTDARRRVAPHLPRFTVCSRIMKPWTAVLGGAGRRPAHFLRAGGAPRPVFGAARIAVGSAGRRFCASDRPLTGADCSQCVTDHGSALGCGCATDCGRPGSAVKAGFVAGRGGIRPRLGAGGAPPARLARCVGEVERERQGALEWVRPEIGACALQSAAAPAASGEPSSALENLGERALNLALGRTHIRSRSPRAGSVGLGREAGSGRALRLGEAPAVVSGGWGTSLDVCRALPAERLSCGGSLAAAVRPRCPSPGCQDPVRCRAGASPRPASSSRLRTGERQRTDARRRVAPHLPRFTVCSRIMKPVGVSVLPLARARDAVRLRRALWRLCARAGPRVLSVSLRPEDSAVALKGRPLVPYERIHRGHAPRRSRRACAPSGPRCSVEPAGARRTSSALVTGADCSQCVTDHGSALGCGCATDCGRPGSAVKAGFVAGRGGIRPRLGAGGAPPARLARCVGEVERERQGALEWVRPEIGACALQSAAAPAASGEPSSALENPGERALNLALGRTHIRSRSPRAGSVGLGREAGSGRALRLGEAPAVVSGGWGTSLDVCRALPAERLSCGGSLAAAVRPRCPSPGCQDPVRCRAGASPRPASSSRLRTGERQRTDARRRVAPHLPCFTVCSRIMKPVGVSVLPLARARDAVRLRRALWRLCARAGPRVLSVSLRPEDSAVALKGRPLVPYERIHRGHAPRRSRRACAPSGPRCSVEPAGARRTSSALVTGADCSQCVTDHGSALGCGCATDCGRPGSAVKAGFVAGRGGIRPRLGAGGAPPARLARCVGEVERERQGALEWVRPEIGACALQSAAAPAASGEPSSALENPGERALNLALGRTHIRSRSPRAGSVGLGREAGSGRALRLGEAPAVVSGGWGTSLDVCRALPAERLSCGGSLAAAVRPRCPSPGCQDPVRCRAGASPRPASSSRLRTGADQGNPTV
ncbi:unnamed protein product [Lampetra fluviatilis]